MDYKSKLIELRANESRNAKRKLANEMDAVSKQIDSCKSVKELQELKIKASQTLKRFEGLKLDLQPFGLWSLDDRNKLEEWTNFWAD